MAVQRPADCHPESAHYAHGLCKRCYQQRWVASNPNYHRNWKVWDRYGLSLEAYEALLAQGCAICGGEAEVIDHNHTTGQVRGALCHRCNRGIGLLRDNPVIVDAAGTYLAGDPR